MSNLTLILIKHHILKNNFVGALYSEVLHSYFSPETRYPIYILSGIYLKISHGCFLLRHPQFLNQSLLRKVSPYIHVHTARESHVVCHISLPWFPVPMVTRLCHQITLATLTIGQIYCVVPSHPGVRG